ncbi:MAG: FAD-binding oxidoreductase [Rhodobacter sp.]|nr:FAD-binding oxidoreductase [Rhodobacter sp.]
MKDSPHIAVVGAGIVGLSCALWLQRKGFMVTLIDPAEPGSGTSSGNACTIAEYGCMPVNSPDLFRRLPQLLLSSDSPLSLDLRYALSHPGWMLQFLLNCREAKVARITRLLGKLLAKTNEGLDPLLEMADAQDLVRASGFLRLYATEAEYRADQAANEIRREQGSEFVEVDSGEIRDLEPNLKMEFARGVFYEHIRQTINPHRLCLRYFEAFRRNGGDYQPRRASAIGHALDQVEVELDDGDRVGANRVVIAAGAFSKQIDGIPVQRLPLDTERGYHVHYDGRQSLLQRPVTWHKTGFYAVPTDEGIRCAGTVEIAGYHERKNPRNLDYIQRHARQMLDLPETPDRDWLGFRPTLPDSLPVIGFSTVSEYIIYAFGHHHLGLTLGGITGKLVAELANGEQPSHNIKPFRPARFL